MALKILVATRKGLFTLGRNGSAAAPWTIERADFLADNVSLVLHDKRSGRLHAALDHGHFGVKMHTCEASGAPWVEQAAPAYPEKPADAPDKDMWGNPLPWSTVRVWALEPGAAGEEGVLWCGTIPGGLFRSQDHGASWAMIETLWRHPKRLQWMGGGADLPGLHSICVDPRDSNVIRIAVSTGGVWETARRRPDMAQRELRHVAGPRAGGKQVRPKRPGCAPPGAMSRHRRTACGSSITTAFSGRTMRARRGTECLGVEPSSFGFAVAVHPKDPDTAWFVPEIKDERRIPR